MGQAMPTESRPDTRGLISGDRALSEHALAARARKAASALHDCGVWQGDKVALLLRNDFSYFEATHGAALLGAATVPLNWHLTADEIGYVLDDCDAKVLIAHADLLTEAVLAVSSGREVIAVRPAPEIVKAYDIPPTQLAGPAAVPDWSAWIEAFDEWTSPPRTIMGPMFYTSGTTGKPKGVKRLPVAPEAAAAAEQRSQLAFGLTGRDIRSVMCGPLYHSAPNAYGMGIVSRGGLLVLQPRFEPLELLGLIESHRITHLHMVPTMFVRLLKLSAEDRQRFDLSSLRHVVHGAAPCPADVKRAMIDWWGPVIHEYYGMTETGIIATSNTQDWLENPGSVGKPALGVEIRIIDDANAVCAAHVAGEICVRSGVTGHVVYHRAEEKTAEMRRGDFVATGDVGYLNENGYLYISDRKSDMVISGGVNIYPAEIEQVLITMPGVRDCAVIGAPDAEFGEQLVAFVQPSEEGALSAEAVRQYLKSHLASYKVPRIVEFAKDLPREDSGKIKKRLLRAAYVPVVAS